MKLDLKVLIRMLAVSIINWVILNIISMGPVLRIIFSIIMLIAYIWAAGGVKIEKK